MKWDMNLKSLQSYVAVQLLPRCYMSVNLSYMRPFLVIALMHGNYHSVMIA